MDPFYAECRAYGRIEEKNCNGIVAVRCHGFTSIPAEREDELAEAFSIDNWERPLREYRRPSTERQPFRAIVKDLVSHETYFSKKMLRRMKADLFKLRDMLVFVRDVRKVNYLGGKLIDFSVSWTMPHLMTQFEINSLKTLLLDLNSELYEFDEMVREEGIDTRVRAAPWTKEDIQRHQPCRSSKRLTGRLAQ